MAVTDSDTKVAVVADNRAAVRAVPTEQLDVVGLALRAAHRDADAVLRGLKRHP
jgi:hypothetical protein